MNSDLCLLLFVFKLIIFGKVSSYCSLLLYINYSIWESKQVKVKVQVYSLISRLVTGSVHSSTISTPRRAYRPAAISAHWTYRTHCHLCSTKYSFSSEAFEGAVPCPRTQHRNNIPRLKGEKHDISLKILYQAGLETARQAATSAKGHAQTIASCPPLVTAVYVCM